MKKRLSVRITKSIFIAVVVVFFVWAFENGYFSKITTSFDEFKVLLTGHLKLVILSSLLAIITAIPLGIIVTRPTYRKSEWFILNLCNLGQTIPSMAILALAIGFLGVGFIPAVLALYIHSILPILRNTVAGIDSIDPKTIESAKGVGFKPSQILFRIELPNAMYAIIAGIRTAIVINVSTATLAFMIGGSGLGIWIINGINMFDPTLLISGAVSVTLLALSFDQLLRLIQFIIIPKPLRHSHSKNMN